MTDQNWTEVRSPLPEGTMVKWVDANGNVAAAGVLGAAMPTLSDPNDPIPRDLRDRATEIFEATEDNVRYHSDTGSVQEAASQAKWETRQANDYALRRQQRA